MPKLDLNRLLLVQILPALVAFCGAPAARAAVPCSIEQAYPEVSALSVVGGRLVATLGKYFSTRADDGAAPVRLVLDGQLGWSRWTEPLPASVPGGAMCMDPPVDVEYLTRNYRKPDPTNGFQQWIDSCATQDGTKWGGIAFYAAEGGWGVGGLVSEDLATGAYDHWHLRGLARYSISVLEYFGGQLWMGMTRHGECIGPEPGFGMKHFDPSSGDHFGIARDVPEVCGFAIRAMAKFDGHLWIASELGLARADIGSDGALTWQNFVPDPDGVEAMRPVTCDGLYEELLRSPRLATDTAFDFGYAFEDFWERLSRLRPQFVSRYLRRLHGHAPAGTAEN